MMYRLLILGLLLILAPTAQAQNDYPPLVGPVVYDTIESLTSSYLDVEFVFHDIGSGEAWVIDGSEHFVHFNAWSPDGCYLLYATNDNPHVSIIDLQRRASTEYNLLADFDEDARIAGRPQWSYDGQQLAYGVYNGWDIEFVAYDILTGEIAHLYRWDGYVDFYSIGVMEWPDEHTLIYRSQDDLLFEVDLTTGQLRYIPHDATFIYPVVPPFTSAIRTPNYEVIAFHFNIDRLLSILSNVTNLNTAAEREQIEQSVTPWSGIEIHDLVTGETETFNLDGQLVRSVEWSPDSSRLAILTWRNDGTEGLPGAYIYDHNTQTMTPVNGIQSITARWSWEVPSPSWSADGMWVTLIGSGHWMVYSLADETITPLTSNFQLPYGTPLLGTWNIEFSPVTHYEPGACG